jgi:hypothetical protein
LVDEALGIVAPNKRVDRIAERVVGTRADVGDYVDEHSRTVLRVIASVER